VEPRRLALDSNVLIYLAKDTERGRRYAPHLLDAVGVVPFAAAAEVLLNARRTKSRALTEQFWLKEFALYTILRPDIDTCIVWAELTAHARDQGTPYQDNDLWIAACALQHNLPLMTHNPRHFEHIEGLRLIHEPDPE